MQAIIIGVRVLTIILFIGGAIFLFARDGVKKLIPKGQGYFNFGSFVNLFSNSCFSLMFHHSLPNIVANLRNTDDVRFVVKNAFIISGSVLLIIPVTGVMAFGEELGTGEDLKYYNFDFQSKIPFIYYITSFYIFLNIAAFSVYIIVIRGSILGLIKPKLDARKFSSTLFLMKNKP